MLIQNVSFHKKSELLTRAKEPAFLCVFRSSGGNNTEIMQKSIENYVRVEFIEYYQKMNSLTSF